MERKTPQHFAAGIGALGVVIVSLSAVLAAVPPLINFQGVLRSPGGAPLPDGLYEITFTIWDDSTGGSLLWTETQDVSATDGTISAPLGESTPLEEVLRPALDAPASGRYLELKVGADPPLEPRIPILSVPYSMTASGVSGDVDTWPGGMRVETTTPWHKYVDLLTADSAGVYIIDKSSPVLYKGLSLGIRESPTMAQGMEAREELLSGDTASVFVGIRESPTARALELAVDDSGSGMSVMDKSSPQLAKTMYVGIRESPTLFGTDTIVGMHVTDNNVPARTNFVGIRESPTKAHGMEAEEELLSGDTARVFVGIRESPTAKELEIAVSDSGAGICGKDKSSPKLFYLGIRESPSLLGADTSIGITLIDKSSPLLYKGLSLGIRESPAVALGMEAEEELLSGDTARVFVGIRESPVAGEIELVVDDSGSVMRVLDKSSPGLFKTMCMGIRENPDRVAGVQIRESPTLGIGTEKKAGLIIDSVLTGLCISDSSTVSVNRLKAEMYCETDGRSGLVLQRRWAQQAESMFGVFADAGQSQLSMGIRESPTMVSSFFDLFVADSNGRLILGSGGAHGRPDRRIVCYADSNETRFSMGEIDPEVTEDFKEYIVYSTGPGGGEMSMMNATGDTCVHLSGHKGWIDIPTGNPPPPTATFERLRLALEAGGLMMTGAGASDTQDTLLCVKPDDATEYLGTGTGAYLSPGGAWTNASDASLKENFRPVNGGELLDKIAALPITRWNYKSESESVQHIGPTAQDFSALFSVGGDDRSISTVDPAGIALAAIQELHRSNEELRAEVARLQELVQRLMAERR